MAVVPLHAVYVVANYKETQLTHVRDGQPVEIAIDSFPGTTLKGHVDSLSPASGLEFALLPPDNATGNFTKIVQRIPVKIVLDDQQPRTACCARACRSSRPSTPRRPWQTRAQIAAESARRLRRRRTDAGRSSTATRIRTEASASRPSAAQSAQPRHRRSARQPSRQSRAKTWIAVIGATLGAFMAVLNIQIVNASLADIQGAIGAGIDDGGWISTSYLIAEIVVIPLTGWLAQRLLDAHLPARQRRPVPGLLGRLRLRAESPQMIVLRAMQGFTGGVLIPMAFTIIITLLPKAKQPIGLALFALSATFAPAIGPTIGGYLTENWGWQYIFYVNLVPGALMIAHAVVLARSRADEARPAARGRLARHRHHGDRPRPRCRPCWRKATRTTGSARPSSSGCRSSPRSR